MYVNVLHVCKCITHVSKYHMKNVLHDKCFTCVKVLNMQMYYTCKSITYVQMYYTCKSIIYVQKHYMCVNALQVCKSITHLNVLCVNVLHMCKSITLVSLQGLHSILYARKHVSIF